MWPKHLVNFLSTPLFCVCEAGIIQTPFIQMDCSFWDTSERQSLLLKAACLPPGSHGGRADPKRGSSHFTSSIVKLMRAAGRGWLHLREEGGAFLLSIGAGDTAASSGRATMTKHSRRGRQRPVGLKPKRSHFKNANADITCSSFQSHSQRY